MSTQNALHKLFADLQADCIFLTRGASARYLLGISLPSDCYAYLSSDVKIVFASPLSIAYVESVAPPWCEVRSLTTFKELKPFVKQRGLAIEASSISHALAQSLRRLGAVLIDASEQLLAMRMIKTSREIASLRRAARITMKAMDEAVVIKGSERRVANEFNKIVSDAGALPLFAIVAGGRRSSWPHSMPSLALARAPLLFDAGCAFNDYCSDITNCYNLNAKQGAQYDSLRAVFDELRALIKPGLRAFEVYELAQQLLRERGFPHLVHDIGHGIGLAISEAPTFKPSKEKERLRLNPRRLVLRTGMVFTLEPAAYFGGYGLRFERMLLLTARGARGL